MYDMIWLKHLNFPKYFLMNKEEMKLKVKEKKQNMRNEMIIDSIKYYILHSANYEKWFRTTLYEAANIHFGCYNHFLFTEFIKFFFLLLSFLSKSGKMGTNLINLFYKRNHLFCSVPFFSLYFISLIHFAAFLVLIIYSLILELEESFIFFVSFETSLFRIVASI